MKTSVLLCTVAILTVINTDKVTSSKCHWELFVVKKTILMGETLELTCNFLGQNVNNTNTSIVDPTGNVLPLNHVTGSKSFDVAIEMSSCSQGGTYICMPDECNRTIVNTVDITVEDWSKRPFLECIFNKYYEAISNFSCKWRPNCEANFFRWALAYKIRNDSQYHECEMTSDTSCIIPNGRPYETYMMKLKMVSRQEERTYNYTYYTDQTIWRLEIQLRNVHAVSSDQLNLNLYVSDSISKMVCEVTYESQWDNTSEQVAFNVSYTYDLEVTLPLGRLESYTMYTISVRCKPRQSLYWSKKTKTEYGRTLPAVPNEIPENVLFADEIDTSGRRRIHLYWDPLNIRQRHGNHTNYSVSYADPTGSCFTEYFSADTVTAMLHHTFLPDKEITLQIGSQNEAGIGSLTKTIRVTRHKQAVVEPVVIVGQNVSNVTMFWNNETGQSGQRSVTYMYYWCQGSNVRGHLLQCYSPLSSLKSSNRTVTIQTGHPASQSWYIGVSVQTDGTAPKRVFWSACYFSDTVSESLRPVDVKVTRHNSTSLRVTMETDFCDFDLMPVRYQVGVYHTDVNCSDTQDYDEDFKAAPSLRQIYINTTYQKKVYVCFRVVFDNGLSVDSGGSVAEINHTDNRGKSVTTAVISGVSVAGAMVALIIIFILVQRYRVRLKDLSKIEDIQVTPSPPMNSYCVDERSTEHSQTYERTASLTDSAYQEGQDYTRSITEIHSDLNTRVMNGALSNYISINRDTFDPSVRPLEYENEEVCIGTESNISSDDDNAIVNECLDYPDKRNYNNADTYTSDAYFDTSIHREKLFTSIEKLQITDVLQQQYVSCLPDSNHIIDIDPNSETEEEATLTISSNEFIEDSVSCTLSLHSLKSSDDSSGNTFDSPTTDSYVQLHTLPISADSVPNPSINSYVLATHSGSRPQGRHISQVNQLNVESLRHDVFPGIPTVLSHILSQSINESDMSTDSAISSTSHSSVNSYVETSTL